MGRFFDCFLEEVEDSKEAFRNYLTFSIRSFLEGLGIPVIQAMPDPGASMAGRGGGGWIEGAIPPPLF